MNCNWYSNNKVYVLNFHKTWSVKNADRWDEYYKNYIINNPDKIKQYNDNRRLHKSHKITKTEWKLCKQYFNYECAYCGLSEEDHKVITSGHQLHKEHAVFNGTNDLSNCIPACRSCNSQKWEYDYIDWYTQENPTFTQARLDKINKWLNEDYKDFIKER